MSEVFLDTSIAIARVVHSPEMKQRIADRISKYQASVISLIVRQEFKRRLLKEAQYLLRQLNEKRSYVKVMRHVVDVLGPWQNRRRNICLEMLVLVHETADDRELTERAIRILRTLLRCGLADLTNSINYEVTESECLCAQYPVMEMVKYKRYDFGSDKCSKVSGGCGIERFLIAHQKELRLILDRLKGVTEKSDELQKSEAFIEAVLEDSSRARALDPCLTVGDLVIALESIDVSAFYTLNRKESLHLSRVLQQDLIIRPKNPQHDDEVLLNSNEHWPDS